MITITITYILITKTNEKFLLLEKVTVTAGG